MRKSPGQERGYSAVGWVQWGGGEGRGLRWSEGEVLLRACWGRVATIDGGVGRSAQGGVEQREETEGREAEGCGRESEGQRIRGSGRTRPGQGAECSAVRARACGARQALRKGGGAAPERGL